MADDNSNDNSDKLYDAVSRIEDKIHSLDISVARLETNFDSHSSANSKYIEQLSRSLSDINTRLLEYGRSLDEHIAGVHELRLSNRLLQEKVENDKQEVQNKVEHVSDKLDRITDRVEVAELPVKVLKVSWYVAKWIGAVTAAGAIVAKLLKML